MKKCIKCNEIKHEHDFYFRTDQQIYINTCFSCARKLSRLYYKTHREEIKTKYDSEKRKQNYQRNKKHIRETQKQYHIKNKEKAKQYRLQNKEYIQERNRQWRLNNPDKVKKYEHKNYQKQISTIHGKINETVRSAIRKSLKGNKNGKCKPS